MTNELAVQTVQGTQLENYGERTMVKELVSRMMAFHPAAGEVGEKGMLMAAQLAILMNASPLPGVNEIHIFKDNKGNIKVEPGINYWMRRSNAMGGVFWVIQPRLMTDQERELYMIPNGIIGAICSGCRKPEMFDMLRAGFTKKEVLDGISITGIGTTTSSDYAKNGRPLSWSAIKRCKTDFYKQAVPYVPGEMLPPAEGLARDETGQLIPNMHRLNYEAMEPIEYGELTDDEADNLNDDIFGSEDRPQVHMVVYDDLSEDDMQNEEIEEEETAAEDDREPNDLDTIRLDLAKYPRMTFVQVANAAVETGLYTSKEHAENALKQNESFKRSGSKLSAGIDGAVGLELFDWLVNRKAD